jgi:hypothetical protein
MKVKQSVSPAGEARSLKSFPKPYEGAGKYFLEDEDVAAVNKAIKERDKTQTALRTARAEKLLELGMHQVNAMQSQLKFSKKEVSESKGAISRLAKETRLEYEPLDLTKLPDYHKHPYPTIAGSCVNRGPMYDGGQANVWGAAIGQVNVAAGAPANGFLGGTCNAGLGGIGGVTARAGIFFFTGEHCGSLQVSSSFLTTGSIFVFGVGWGACREIITLRLAILGLTEGAWLADTGFDIANMFEWIGSGFASFENQPNMVFANADVKSNRTYWIQAETVIEADVVGGAGCDATIATSLRNIQACL